MDERVMEIVLYIVDSIDSSTEENILTRIKDISEGLVERGYTEKEISSAFDIIMQSLSNENPAPLPGTKDGKNGKKSRGRKRKAKTTKLKRHFIYQVNELDIVGEEEVERIIQRSLLNGKNSTSISEIKAIIDHYLFDPNELQSNSFFIINKKYYGN